MPDNRHFKGRKTCTLIAKELHDGDYTKITLFDGNHDDEPGADPGGGPRGPGLPPPLTTKNEAPAPKFYKNEAPEWQF